MVRLPVTQAEFEFRPRVGADDLLSLEAPRLDMELAVELAGRLASVAAGVTTEQLPVPDLDALYLLLRQRWFGDVIRAEALCPQSACGKRIDISFRISDYLSHHQPRRPVRVTPADEPGWFRLSGCSACFRLPSMADLIELRGSPDPAGERATRCIRPEPQPAAVVRRIEAAMAAMAPILCQDLETRCPECSATIHLRFDPQTYTLTELRAEAQSIHEDVYALASTYHWAEADILAMPLRRRPLYAEMARAASRSA